MKKVQLFFMSLLVLITVSISVNAYTFDNEDDAYLESMMFGDIPEVFSALKISQNMIKAPASIAVFTEEDIRVSQARTIGDLLKYVPGLYITPSRSGFDLIKVRGAQDRYNNRVLLVIDGIPRRELFYGYTSIGELVPVENIKQLEIIRGPGSALYGTDAYTGVISIFTKTAETSDKVNVDIGYGKFNTKRLNVGLGQKAGEKTYISFNGRYFGSGGYEVGRGRDGNNSSETTSKDGYNFDIKLKYNGFSFSASHAALNYRYPWVKIRRRKDRVEKNTTYGFGYRNDFTEKLGVDIRLYQNSFDFLEDQVKFNADGSDNEFSKSIQENSIIGGDAHLIHQITANNQLVVGGAFERENTGQNEEMTRNPGQNFTVAQWIQNQAGEKDFYLQNFAFYLENIWKMDDQFELTLGARYDNFEQFGDSVNPRVGAVYTPMNNLTLKALYGEAFRGPTYKDLFLKEFDNANNVVPSSRSNPALEAESIKTYEFEINYAYNDNLLSKIRYFSNINENAIISLGEGIPYANLDGIESDGFEVEFKYSYENITGFVNLTMISGEKSDGSPIEGYPDYQIKSALHYSPTHRVESRLGVRFISDRSRPSDYHIGIDPGVGYLIDQDNLGSYFDVELSVLYRINNKWSIAANVANLLDNTHYNPSYEPGEYWDIIHPGRSFFLNLNYRLPQ